MSQSLFARILTILIATALLVTSFSQEAEARRRRSKSKKHKTPVINEKKLYERLGGAKAVSDIVDEWLRLSLADERIAPFFAKTTAKPDRLAKLRRGLNDQICELADGPCQYKGPDMHKAHAGMKFEEEHFVAFSEDLFKSLQKFNVPEREKNELLGRLGGFKSEMLPEESDAP